MKKRREKLAKVEMSQQDKAKLKLEVKIVATFHNNVVT